MNSVGSIQNIEALDLEFLRECFDLDEDAGVLIWRERPMRHFARDSLGKAFNTRFAGKRVGSASDGNALAVHLMGKHYFVHRIIFALKSGVSLSEVPGIIDHIDGNVRNNRPANMRPVTDIESLWNRGMQRNMKYGFKGISPEPNGRWSAVIKDHGVQVHLGTFDSREEAGAAYIGAAKILHGQYFREIKRTQAAA